jgi:serine/threonine-protein kinase PpkA
MVSPSIAIAQPASRQPLLMEGKQTLFQRAIARPGATIHDQPGVASGRPIPGFSIFYIYERRQINGVAWAQVGAGSDGRVDGWLPAEKLIDWRHTMVGAFTNPAGRERVMFFDSSTPARALIQSTTMAATAAQLRQRALATSGSGGIVALEPERFVDITQNFYLLPILTAQRIERLQGPAMNLLEVVSVPSIAGNPVPPDPAAMRNFKGQIVFVIDTTISMQPYIDRTRDLIRQMIARIGDTAVSDNFRFGMVAFRNNVDFNPRIEYVSKVIARPDFSTPPASILPALEQVRESPVSTETFSEDPISGLRMALNDIDWERVGGRWIVLISDAGAREASDPKSNTRLGIDEIRQLAQQKGVALMAVHLLTPEGQRSNNHAIAREQYSSLSRFGAAGSLYYPVRGGSPEEFRVTIERITQALLGQVGQIVGRSVGGVPPAGNPQNALDRQIEVVGNAMRLAYLGRVENTAAPDILRAFTADRDWKDPALTSVDIRVLLTRSQLSDLTQSLNLILEAGLRGRTDPRAFFTQLRTAAAVAARDPRRLGQIQRVGAVLGEYLDGLPYQSQIMDVTEADWLSMGAGGQREILNSVEAKQRLYREFNAQPQLWVSFDSGRVPGDAVFPVPLEALP